MNNSLSLRVGNLLISLSLNEQTTREPGNAESNNVQLLALNEEALSKLTERLAAKGESAEAQRAKVEYLGELRRRLL